MTNYQVHLLKPGHPDEVVCGAVDYVVAFAQVAFKVLREKYAYGVDICKPCNDAFELAEANAG